MYSVCNSYDDNLTRLNVIRQGIRAIIAEPTNVWIMLVEKFHRLREIVKKNFFVE